MKENNTQMANSDQADVIKSVFGKWTSIEESKPPYGIGVLIAMKNGFITTAYRKKSAPLETTWYVYHDNLTLDDVVITHWMPLPNLPKTV